MSILTKKITARKIHSGRWVIGTKKVTFLTEISPNDGENEMVAKRLVACWNGMIDVSDPIGYKESSEKITMEALRIIGHRNSLVIAARKLLLKFPEIAGTEAGDALSLALFNASEDPGTVGNYNTDEHLKG